eukprot:scaffold3515_cov126-Cylindrotheca_fusiformis.AAC.36
MVQMKRRGIRTRLPLDYVPEEYTVLCGRGKEYTSSTGNQHLKSLIHKNQKVYSEASTKVAKSAIVSEIIRNVRSVCPEPTFVKFEEGVWWEVDTAFAREKIGCMFRDALHTQYRSSTKAKFARKTARSSSTMRQAESVPTIISIGSSSSVASSSASQSYDSSLAEEIFGPQPNNTGHPGPAQGGTVLHGYGSVLFSYPTAASPQPSNPNVPITKNKFSLASDENFLDDFPDDLSAIFNDT